MKILIIHPSLNKNRIGGMERFVIEFSTGLQKAGHKVTILTAKIDKYDVNLKNIKIKRVKVCFPK